ncbi:unnamed protein product [Lactuca saligna]|uniref:Uncharacterized protein n=1 Tax=Lactuca saligna TaxID=75948 RepID=A0AA35V1I1_LACSI|nr:unnamed protein product [Lactuca saligna]
MQFPGERVKARLYTLTSISALFVLAKTLRRKIDNGSGFRLTKTLWGEDLVEPGLSYHLPKLFGSNLNLGKHLGNITIAGRNWEDFIFAADDMSAAWRAYGKMAQMFIVRCRVEAKISLEMALCGSSGHVSSSQPTVGVVSPVRLPVSVPSGFLLWVQEGRGCDLTWKRQSFHVVLSSDEETESDDAGLRPRKARRIVYVARLLGDTGGILGGQFSVPEKKEVVLVPSSPKASPSPSTSSPMVSPGFGSMSQGASSSPGDTTAQEWSRCNHPPAMMSSLAGQSSAHMASDLCYVVAQTSALMVAVTDRVRRAGVN